MACRDARQTHLVHRRRKRPQLRSHGGLCLLFQAAAHQPSVVLHGDVIPLALSGGVQVQGVGRPPAQASGPLRHQHRQAHQFLPQVHTHQGGLVGGVQVLQPAPDPGPTREEVRLCLSLQLAPLRGQILGRRTGCQRDLQLRAVAKAGGAAHAASASKRTDTGAGPFRKMVP